MEPASGNLATEKVAGRKGKRRGGEVGRGMSQQHVSCRGLGKAGGPTAEGGAGDKRISCFSDCFKFFEGEIGNRSPLAKENRRGGYRGDLISRRCTTLPAGRKTQVCKVPRMDQKCICSMLRSKDWKKTFTFELWFFGG